MKILPISTPHFFGFTDPPKSNRDRPIQCFKMPSLMHRKPSKATKKTTASNTKYASNATTETRANRGHQFQFFCVPSFLRRNPSLVTINAQKKNKHPIDLITQQPIQSTDKTMAIGWVDTLPKPSVETYLIGDLEGEFFSLLGALVQCGMTNIEPSKDDADMVGYFAGSFPTHGPQKRLVILGDICDRGLFGIHTLKTIQNLMESKPDWLRIDFVLGNHDIPYLLGFDTSTCVPNHIPQEFQRPSICSVPGDACFHTIQSIFTAMNNKDQLRMALWDPTKRSLISHAVFTAGSNGFVSKFHAFLTNNHAFMRHISRTINMEQLGHVMNMLMTEPSDTIQNEDIALLIDAYNQLISPEFIRDTANRDAVLRLLIYDDQSDIQSPLQQRGATVSKGKARNAFSKNCYPLPHALQINGHYHMSSRIPARIYFKTFKATLIKLDCASSSQMLPGSSDAFPTFFGIALNGKFRKYDIQFSGKHFKYTPFIARLKSMLDSSLLDDSQVSVMPPPEPKDLPIPAITKAMWALFLNDAYTREMHNALNSAKDMNKLFELPRLGEVLNSRTDTVLLRNDANTRSISINTLQTTALELVSELFLPCMTKEPV